MTKFIKSAKVRAKTVERLKNEYVRQLTSFFLSEEEVAKVREENRHYNGTGRSGIDAAHNYCDANMAMYSAFCRIMARDPQLGEDTPESAKLQDHDFDLMNDAMVRLV